MGDVTYADEVQPDFGVTYVPPPSREEMEKMPVEHLVEMSNLRKKFDD